jgi:predicted ATPase/class 3 adenylate cyclase/tetratricopeptide (TPR) repeat protein/DNA-binding XRE family transcriptional regulator
VDGYSFGEWLRKRRSALLLSRDDLARQVGCAVVTLRKIEADERRPSLAIAERLAKLLDVSGDEQALFIQVARGLASADRLPPPIPRGAAPAPIVPPTLPPATPILPSGTITFLFTDIAGSTQLWEQHPQEMPSALAHHDAVLRQAITAHGGVVFKTVGDAFYAAFVRAPDAFAAALDAQSAIYNLQSTIDVRVRMALHTGVAEERDGDYFGPPLNRVARLLVTGHGGQILLSLATAELVREHLPAGAELRDLGTHRLKDLSRPEQIFQLVTADLPATFPALNTLDLRRTNLPAQPTLLIGREQEVATICGLLRRSEVRLLTLTGPGGTGKTRLGLQVAAELLDEFEHGVYFVNLAPISDPSLVASAIAQTLGLTETGGQPPAERLQHYLREKQLLLLLDNFEQVLDAASLVAELLAATPQLKVLITSRTTLHLSGEHEFSVPPLAVPPLARTTGEGEQNLPLSPAWERGPGGEGELTQYAAVQLFIARAQAALADFVVTNATAPAVAEICVRLDGLPLAIELAAARIKVFAPEQLLVRLGRRLSLLTGGPRDRPARQQTLRQTIDWSYQLLSQAEQTLFRRLSVFVGGWTLEAAEAACTTDADRALDVLEGLTALVDQSLVRQSVSTAGPTRFVMLETIREYALERLEGSSEADEVRRRHAEYYLASAEEAGRAKAEVHLKAWLDQMALEHDNLRAALAWAFGGRDVVVGMRFVGVLPRFWFTHGHWSEGKAWFAAALAVPAPAPASEVGQAAWKAARAYALLWVPYFAMAMEDEKIVEKKTSLYEAQALFREIGNTHGIAWTLLEEGKMEWSSGNYPQATALAEESLALFRNLGDTQGIAHTLHTLGDKARDQGDLAQGAALLEESLARCWEAGLVGEAALVLNGLGDVPCMRGDYAQAMARYWESLAVCQQLGDRSTINVALANLGLMALIQGDDGRVLALLQEHVTWLREKTAFPTSLTASPWSMDVIDTLGALMSVRGDATQASALLREGLILKQQFGWQRDSIDSLERFAWAAARQGQTVWAAHLLGAAAAFRTAWPGGYWPAGRAAYAHTVATVRAQLDEAAFAAAWAAGQALTLEQAIAEALGEGA